MKYTCTVHTKTKIYKFNSKEEYDKFQRLNEDLILKVVERVDIIEEMDKIVQPPKITVKMVWDRLNIFIEQQMKFNQLILERLGGVEARLDVIENRLNAMETRLEMVIKANNLLTIKVDKIIQLNNLRIE